MGPSKAAAFLSDLHASLIQQMMGYRSFPPVQIVHTSDTHRGQIYLPVINFLLLLGCLALILGFGTDVGLTNAYGFAVAGTLVITTLLIALNMIFVRQYNVYFAIGFFLFFGFLDMLFFAGACTKIPHGAYVTLAAAAVISSFLIFWTWGRGLEDGFDAHHRMRMNELFTVSSRDEKEDAKAGMVSYGGSETAYARDEIETLPMQDEKQAKVTFVDAFPENLSVSRADGSIVELPRVSQISKLKLLLIST